MDYLAIGDRDVLIISGMFLGIGYAIYQAFRCWLFAVKCGVLVSCVAICLGLAYFGWIPLFGGSHDVSTYFGSIMLFLGILFTILFIAIDQATRKPQEENPRGFPVIMVDKSKK